MAEIFTGRIKIINIPDGEAPLWVRQAWLGQVLPCHPILGYSDDPETGAVSGRQVEKRYCFTVPQDQSITILELTNPDAAEYWRSLGFPQDGKCFAFDELEAEIISGVTRQNIRVFNDLDDYGSSDWLFKK